MRARDVAAHVAMQRRLGFARSRRRVPIARPPRLVESDYAARLADEVGRWRAAIADLIAGAPTMLERHRRERADGAEFRADAGEMRHARALLDRARDRVAASASRAESDARRVADAVTRHHRAELDRQTEAGLGVRLPTSDRGLHALVDHFAHENAALIRSLGERTLGDVEKAVANAFRTGARHETLADEIARRFEIADNHARLIARDQIGKLNAQVTRARHRELGIARFRWLSMHDERVRPHHEAMTTKNGGVWSYEGPGRPSFFPGEEVLCRCAEQPLFDEILALVDDLLEG